MTTQPDTLGERVARIEGALDHLATKADIEALRADLQGTKSSLQFQMFAGLATVTGIILAAMRLWV